MFLTAVPQRPALMLVPMPQAGIYAIDPLHRFLHFTVHRGPAVLEAALQPDAKATVHPGLLVTMDSRKPWRSHTHTHTQTLALAAQQEHTLPPLGLHFQRDP